MEKRKLLPLSMLLLCGLCFTTACSTPSTTTNVIATVNGTKITTDTLYNNTLYNEQTAAYIYEILEKALIQSATPSSATASMTNRVENEVEKWRKAIEENSKLNQTDYEEDLKTALEAEGVSSVEEYKEVKIYNLQKEYAKTKFLEAKGNDYHNAFIDNNYLYHIGDINLSISNTSTNTDLYNVTISSTEAKNIYDAFTELVGGEKYYNIASKYSSGDNASSGGDLGIVTLNDTDITNELRYALVGYSSLIDNKYEEFSLPTNVYSKVLSDIYSAGIQTIPYSYIKGMNDVYSSTDTSETKFYESSNSFYYSGGGNSVSSSSKVYYRNIVFNSLLNTKIPKFITVTQEDVEAGAKAVLMDVLTPNVKTHGYSLTTSKQYVLVNEEGNPYVVYKDSNGLHILTIHKTPFDENIHDYYSSEISDTDGKISYAEYGSNVEERLNEVKSLSEKYITKSYGSSSGDQTLLSFEMFKYYLEQPNGNFKITDENVKKMINQYMESKVEYSNEKLASNYEGYYDTYSNLIWFAYGNPEEKNGDKVTAITKEVPLLSCLSKGEDGNYMCVYKYGEGFIKHDGGSK